MLIGLASSILDFISSFFVSATQLTLAATVKKTTPLELDNPRYIDITQAICRFIEGKGFKHLMKILVPRYRVPSRIYITDQYLIPLFHECKKQVISTYYKLNCLINFN